MNIITNNYEKVLQEMIFNQFSDNLKRELDKNINRNNIFNYIDLLANLDQSLCEIARSSLTTIFNAIDLSYRNSTERKSKYHVKAFLPRTILTVFEEIVSFYVINDNKENFIYFCDSLLKSFPHRENTILTKRDYILNNWKNILNLYKFNLSCPMESQISHNLAYLLTSRPKGYSLKMLSKIIEIRLLNRNRENIKLLYLNNFNKNNIIEFKKEDLNYDILEKDKIITPFYLGKIYTPNIVRYI